jgi:hypothetical protein
VGEGLAASAGAAAGAGAAGASAAGGAVASCPEAGVIMGNTANAIAAAASARTFVRYRLVIMVRVNRFWFNVIPESLLPDFDIRRFSMARANIESPHFF